MVKRKRTDSASLLSTENESSSKKKKKIRKSEEAQQVGGEPVVKKSGTPDEKPKLEIFPREHVGSPFCDSRIYIPTVKEFMADSEQGSMLDEVSLLPLEELTRLVCGRTVHSLIKNTAVGRALTKRCKELQEGHALLDLKEIANRCSIRKRSFKLLRHEGCSDEFLLPSAISSYITVMLHSVIKESSWRFNVKEFSNRLSQRLVLARPGVQLADSSLYSYKIYELDHLSEKDYTDIQEQAKLTDKEVKQLLESLLANILRFFILYSVHGLRDQVITKLSNSGEVMYKLRYPAPVATVVSVSDEVLKECIPLEDDYIPLVKDMRESQPYDCSSLRYQIAHLPIPKVVRLILGEVLYNSVSRCFPAFLEHLEEYAAELKVSQSANKPKKYLLSLRKRKQDANANAVRWKDIDGYLFMILAPAHDWGLLEKVKYLRNLLKEKILHLKPQDNEQPLWNSNDCDHGPAKLYYPLRRFAKCPNSLPKALLKKISRRFNHFFMVYAIHAFREGVRIHGNSDKALFFLNPCPTDERSRKVSEKVDEGHLPSKSAVEAASQSLAVPIQSSRTTKPGGAEDWEVKFYEQVKEDSTAPSYFKTTLGILVANNQDLRKESSFLQACLKRA